MSVCTELQNAVTALLQTKLECPVLARRDKELKNDIEAAVSKHGLCVWVMPPLPTHALQAEQPFVFFDGAEIRVRIMEETALNQTGTDVYDAAEAVAVALHWSNPGGILAHPLMLGARPVAVIEEKSGRTLEVIFEAQYQLS